MPEASDLTERKELSKADAGYVEGCVVFAFLLVGHVPAVAVGDEITIL